MSGIIKGIESLVQGVFEVLFGIVESIYNLIAASVAAVFDAFRLVLSFILNNIFILGIIAAAIVVFGMLQGGGGKKIKK